MESRGLEDDIAVPSSLKEHGLGNHISHAHFIGR